jgi:hypothetical protein
MNSDNNFFSRNSDGRVCRFQQWSSDGSVGSFRWNNGDVFEVSRERFERDFSSFN